MKDIVIRKDDLYKNKIVISERDVEMVQLISNGWRFEEIADKYCLSKRTIEGHMNRLRDLLDCKTVAQLSCEFIRKGLIK